MAIEARVPRTVATGFILLCVISGSAEQGLAVSSGAQPITVSLPFSLP
jgi:hypothetical protein